MAIRSSYGRTTVFSLEDRMSSRVVPMKISDTEPKKTERPLELKICSEEK
jgi:hypothetical protein